VSLRGIIFMKARTTKEEILRLEKYVEKLQNELKRAKTQAHTDFFNRDIKKTLKKIEILKS
jgi:hypothetical protein